MDDDEIQYIGTRSAGFVTGIRLRVENDDLVFHRATSSVVAIGRRPSHDERASPGAALFRCAVVSRKHAKIAFSDSGHAYLIDLHSHHGTHIRKPHELASRMLPAETPVELDDGDIVTFGKSVGRSPELVRPVVARIALLHDPPKPIHIDLTAPNHFGIYGTDDDDDDDDTDDPPASGPNALPLARPRVFPVPPSEPLPPPATATTTSAQPPTLAHAALQALKRLLPPAPAHIPPAAPHPIVVYNPSPRSAALPRSPLRDRSTSPMDLASPSPSPASPSRPLPSYDISGDVPASKEAQSLGLRMSIDAICWADKDTDGPINEHKSSDDPRTHVFFDDDSDSDSDDAGSAADDHSSSSSSSSDGDLYASEPTPGSDAHRAHLQMAALEMQKAVMAREEQHKPDEEEEEESADEGGRLGWAPTITGRGGSGWSSDSQAGSPSPSPPGDDTLNATEIARQGDWWNSSSQFRSVWWTCADNGHVDVDMAGAGPQADPPAQEDTAAAAERHSQDEQKEKEPIPLETSVHIPYLRSFIPPSPPELEDEEEKEQIQKRIHTIEMSVRRLQVRSPPPVFEPYPDTNHPPHVGTQDSTMALHAQRRRHGARLNTHVQHVARRLGALAGRLEALEGGVRARVEESSSSEWGGVGVGDEGEDKDKDKDKGVEESEAEARLKKLNALVDGEVPSPPLPSFFLSLSLSGITDSFPFMLTEMHALHTTTAAQMQAELQLVKDASRAAIAQIHQAQAEAWLRKTENENENENEDPPSPSPSPAKAYMTYEQARLEREVQQVRVAPRAPPPPAPRCVPEHAQAQASSVSSSSLKRKRSSVEDADDAEAEAETHTASMSTAMSAGRPTKARRLAGVAVQTATAVTVGAIATWGALAFS
ncbi:hypothetical protein H0H87_008300 [Tephrocybe sp. NHM501043]|nr:hypothetical protein H0H87_008300 [Tephrocybe sp. NHM501043]